MSSLLRPRIARPVAVVDQPPSLGGFRRGPSRAIGWCEAVAAAVAITLGLLLFLPFTQVVTRFFVVRSVGGDHVVAAAPRPTDLGGASAVEGAGEQGPSALLFVADPVPAAPRAREATGDRHTERQVEVPTPRLPEVAENARRELVFSVAQLDFVPFGLLRESPVYPAELSRQGIEGSVRAQFVVDRQGRTRDLVIVNASHPEFAAAVEHAVRRWRFVPGRVKGEVVEFRVELPVTFVLRGRSSEPLSLTAAVDPW
jgi:TonB family protein